MKGLDVFRSEWLGSTPLLSKKTAPWLAKVVVGWYRVLGGFVVGTGWVYGWFRAGFARVQGGCLGSLRKNKGGERTESFRLRRGTRERSSSASPAEEKSCRFGEALNQQFLEVPGSLFLG